MHSFAVAINLLVIIAICGARHVSVGELDDTLRRAGADPNDLNTWNCIVREESQYETTAHNTQSGDHGIFQINEVYWCSNSNQHGGGCGITCASLRDDDINNDAQCAVFIYNDAKNRWGDGFVPWTTYSRCR